jgi:very-short-patch-repair endonuclease
MYWELPNRRVILELDGKMKYQTPNDIYKEKRREDTLRAMGFEVVRAVWADVISGALVKRLHEIKIPQRRYYGRKFPRWHVAEENPEEPD